MAAATKMTELVVKPGESSGPVSESNSFVLLKQRLGEAVGARMALGSLPTGPPTLRARIGALLIRCVQRALFWFIPQLDRFHAAVIGIEQQQMRVSEEMAAEQCNSGTRVKTMDAQIRQFQGAYERAVRELETSAREMREHLSRIEYAIRGTEQRFQDLEQRFQAQREELPVQLEQLRLQIAHSSSGPVAVRGGMRSVQAPQKALQSIAGILKNHLAGTARMPVLDISSGDGKWLEVLESAGVVAQGVEEDFVLAAAGACKGLRVVAADPVAYLNSLPAASMGAVTALNAIDRMSFPQLIVLLDETVRILVPGGISLFVTFGRIGNVQDGGSENIERKSADMLAALARLRGLGQTELMCLTDEHTTPVGATPADWTASMEEELPTIYALVGRKSQPATGDTLLL